MQEKKPANMQSWFLPYGIKWKKEATVQYIHIIFL